MSTASRTANRTPTRRPSQPVPAAEGARAEAPKTDWGATTMETALSSKAKVPMTKIKEGTKTVGQVLRIDINKNKADKKPEHIYKVSGKIVYNKEVQGLVIAGGGKQSYAPIKNQDGTPKLQRGTDKPLKEVVLSIPAEKLPSVAKKLSAYSGGDGRAARLSEALEATLNCKDA